MKYKNTIIHLIQIFLIVLFISSIVTKDFQNDTFFTIAIGERILEYGVETEEKLVWHENLEFTNSRWLFDTIIAIINNYFGYLGIYVFVILVSSAIGILYYFIINSIIKKKNIAFLITVFIMYISRNVFAARAQIMSFLLILIEFWAIEKLLETNKKRYFTVLLIIPLVLANIHASVFPMYFVLFLPYIAEFILSKLKINNSNKLIIKNRNIKMLIILIPLAILLSFCTPKAVSPYSDMFKVMNGVSTEFIAELSPININQELALWGLLLVTISLMIFTNTKLRITDGLFILGFALMSLSTYRCVCFFYFISSIGIIRFVNDFLNDNQINLDMKNTKLKTLIIGMIYVYICLISINSLLTQMKNDYIDTATYPYNATEYILNNLDKENIKIFNHFNFGAYLEVKGVKAFIDSRSGIFTEEFNPGTTILNDWLSVKNGSTHYREIFNRYNITHALLYNDEVITVYISNDPEWKLIYQDDRFSLYEKNER